MNVTEQCRACQSGNHNACTKGRGDVTKCCCATATAAVRPWQVGDKVSLFPSGDSGRATGVVTAIDEEGRPRGVRVEFDHPFRGADNGYATHAELTLLERAHSDAEQADAMRPLGAE